MEYAATGKCAKVDPRVTEASHRASSATPSTAQMAHVQCIREGDPFGELEMRPRSQIGSVPEAPVERNSPPQFSREVVRNLNASIASLNGKIACAEAARIGVHAVGLCAALPLLISQGAWGAVGIVAGSVVFGVHQMAVQSERLSRFIETLEFLRFFHRNNRVEGIVRQLSESSKIQTPRTFILASGEPNAGILDYTLKSDVLLCADSMVRTLNESELRGVLAHELAHSNRSLTKFLVFNELLSYASMPSILCGGCLTLMSLGITLPAAAGGALLATLNMRRALAALSGYIHRQTEHKTDLRAVAITGDPEGLISALRKLPDAPDVSEPGGIYVTHPRTHQRIGLMRRVFGRGSEDT